MYNEGDELEYRNLFIFVEGDDDERFVDAIVKDQIPGNLFTSVVISKYAQQTKRHQGKFLGAAERLEWADYYLLGDINGNPCATEKKLEVIKQFDMVDPHKVIVVKAEIESWYLAGVTQDYCSSLGISYLKNTETVTKEIFDKMIPSRFSSRIDFMMELLKQYSLKEALHRNQSLEYLCGRLNIKR